MTMEQIKNEMSATGTKILLGNHKTMMISNMRLRLIQSGFTEIHLPALQRIDSVTRSLSRTLNRQSIGTISTNAKYANCVLAPTYMNVMKHLATERFKFDKEARLFYVAECFRDDNFSPGRLRQFTVFGVHIMNPINPDRIFRDLTSLCRIMIVEDMGVVDVVSTLNNKMNSDIFIEDKGFTINKNKYGKPNKIASGGKYENGMGFEIGIDRILDMEGKKSKVIAL